MGDQASRERYNKLNREADGTLGPYAPPIAQKPMIDQRLIAHSALAEFRAKLQAFCFYYKQTPRRGICKEMNGHYCVFCELSDELDRILG
jgi:hypothetical protein